MKTTALLLLLTIVTSTSMAQKRQIDFEALAKGTFAARGVHGIRSMSDGEHYTTQKEGVIVRYRYVDGVAVDTIFDAAKYSPVLKFTDFQFSDDESKILFQTDRQSIYRHSSTCNYWVFDRVKNELYPLSNSGKQQEATLSPDASKVAFVRENNLFIVDLARGVETQITSDGVKGSIINGIPDWVYEEEYVFSRAFEWSPSSDVIAYYRFDETHVREYSMTTYNGKLYPVNQNFKYPKAGETNSIVQIHTYDLAKQTTTKMDIGTVEDQYIPRIKWTARPNELSIHRVNRAQNSYQMLFANALTGTSQVIYSEQNAKYVERIDDDKVTFLPGGKHFLVLNESDGWKHLYLYDMAGKMVSQVTKGAWEVATIDGIDPVKNRLYYTSTERSTIGRDLYVVNIGNVNAKGTKEKAGKVKPNSGKRLLSTGLGYNTVAMSRGAKYYINNFSNATTPNVVSLHNADGKLIRTIEDNAELCKHLEDWDVPVKEFFEIEINGHKVNAYIIKPSDFDATRKYPLFMTQYSGPGSQSVANRWGVSWELALVKEGYIVACVDGRGTGFRGEEFRKCTYGNLGYLEVQDQTAAARWFAQQSYIDPARMGIYGWSYGGFMSLNCILKAPDVFAMAISVAPVTSWRYYNTIYTELYNGSPLTNPAGYDDNSPINFADNLRGRLLLAHGTADDNVHIQNSYEMIERLVNADKDFEWLIYPDKDHGMGKFRPHLTKKMITFVKENL